MCFLIAGEYKIPFTIQLFYQFESSLTTFGALIYLAKKPSAIMIRPPGFSKQYISERNRFGSVE
ncbi:MAG: hypothetical protein OSB25_07665 [Salibacteraceae bacterium]|nr:hypothetical protein [Salibacteraceae bacterium]|tara:strand:- start:27682 stop:27873 length:192 start_codon:yes stop_codon:yes gene_type:complete